MKSIVYKSFLVGKGICNCGNRAKMKIFRRLRGKGFDKTIAELSCKYCYEFYKKIPFEEVN